MKLRNSSLASISLLTLAVVMASACGSGSTSTSPPATNPDGPQVKVSPAPEKIEGPTNVAPDNVLVSTNPTPDSPWILSVRNHVNLKRMGAMSFNPILEKIDFETGDVLQVESDSIATVLCSDRGICDLAMGTYTSCCIDSCKTQVQMLRIGTGPSTPILKRTDLPAEDAQKLNAAEASIRQLELGPVTTQFLITRLYSGWKLEETNQELDRLTNQLKQPEAKQELKGLYLPVIRKTGDMHLKVNQVDKAKELYQLNISSQSNDSVEKAAAHEGLATAYKQAGDSNQAVRNYELARDIYVKQGDKKAATATEQKISNTRMQSVEKVAPKTNVRSRVNQ